VTDKKYEEILTDEMQDGPFPADFVRNEIMPRVIEMIKDFGDGYLVDDASGCSIHTREIEALVNLVEGKCK
jgi:hypothetical protein